MRNAIALLAIFLLSPFTYACEGEATYTWMNPDGSMGGQVSYSAKVASGTVVSPQARVCGAAWVEAGVKILDSAMIADGAWVGPFVEMHDQAEIGEFANVKGSSPQSLVAMRDKSRVAGKAKLHGKILLSDRARVHGAARIGDHVVMSGESAVCEDIFLEDQGISDDEYCLGKATSAAQVSYGGVDFDSYNSAKSKIDINLPEGFIFGGEISLMQFYANGKQVSQDAVTRWGDRIRLNLAGLLQDGANTLSFRSYDQHKKIITDEIEFEVGTTERTFAVIAPDGSTSKEIASEVFVLHEGQKKGLPHRWLPTGELRVEGIPASEETPVLIALLGKSSWGLWVGETNDIPEELQMEWLPETQSVPNNDFSQGLLGWHPFGGGEVEVSMGRLSLAASGLGMTGVKTSFLRGEGASIVQTALGLRADSTDGGHYAAIVGVFEPSRRRFSVDFVESDTGPVSFRRSLRDYGQSQADLVDVIPGSRVGVIQALVVLHEGNARAGAEGESEGIQQPEASFRLQTYARPTVGLVNFPSAGPPVGSNESPAQLAARCEHPLLRLTPSDLGTSSVSYLQDLQLLSIGGLPEFWPLGQPRHTRLYGNLTISGPTDPSLIRLEVWDPASNIRIAQAPLNPCLVRHLDAISAGSTGAKTYNFRSKPHEAMFLFALPEPVVPLMVQPNEVLLRYMHGEIELGSISRPSLYSLASALGREGYRDFYDYQGENGKSTTRGGGDFWGRLNFGPLITSILGKLGEEKTLWQLNDISIANGAKFFPRKGNTHTTGQDFDTRHATYNFNQGTPEAHFSLAQGLERDLLRVAPHYGSIREIYVEAGDGPLQGYAEGLIESSFWKVFANKCFANTRAIDPKYAVERPAGGSLLRQVSPHKDHVHFRLNPATGEGQVPSYTFRPLSHSLDQFKFSLFREAGSWIFRVAVRNPQDFTDRRIMLRLQSTAQLGVDTRVYANSGFAAEGVRVEIPVQGEDFPVPHASIVVWDTEGRSNAEAPGGCQAFELQLSLDDLCPSQFTNGFEDWFYRKNQDDTFAVVGSTNVINEGSYIHPSSKVCGQHVSLLDTYVGPSTEISNYVDSKRRAFDLSIEASSFNNSSRFEKIGGTTKIKAAGVMNNLHSSGGLEIEGKVGLFAVTITNSEDALVRIRQGNPEIETHFSQVEISNGSPQFEGKVTAVTSQFIGSPQILAGQGEIGIINGSRIESFEDNELAHLKIATEGQPQILLDDVEIKGRPSISHSLAIFSATIEGNGTYKGIYAPLVGGAAQGLSVMHDAKFSGENNFQGAFILSRPMQDSAVFTNPAVDASYVPYVEVGAYGDPEVPVRGVDLRGAVVALGELGDGVQVEGLETKAGNIVHHVSMTADSAIRGADTRVYGMMFMTSSAIDGNSDVEANLLTPQGVISFMDASTLVGVIMRGSGTFQRTTLFGAFLLGFSCYEDNQTCEDRAKVRGLDLARESSARYLSRWREHSAWSAKRMRQAFGH